MWLFVDHDRICGSWSFSFPLRGKEKDICGSWPPPRLGRTTLKRKEEMNMKRRTLALLLGAALALTLTACGGDSGTSQPPAGDSQSPVSEAPVESETPAVEIPPVEDLTGVDTSAIPGVEDGVLTVGMECVYAPYNWTQTDDSNGAVPIVNNPGSYANGYDVMIAKRICEAYGWELEVMALEWGGLTPGLQSGVIDVAIAGQSMTADRLAEVDMAGPYYYATIVCVTTKDSQYASATSIDDLAGGLCVSQSGTIWHTTCLPQIPDAQIQSPADTAPAMIMALESGTVDFICTDMPTATAAVAKNDNLVILNFSGTDGDFQFASEEERAENVNIGMSVVKGNTQLLDALNTVIGELNEEQFNAIMAEAIAVQPEI